MNTSLLLVLLCSLFYATAADYTILRRNYKIAVKMCYMKMRHQHIHSNCLKTCILEELDIINERGVVSKNKLLTYGRQSYLKGDKGSQLLKEIVSKCHIDKAKIICVQGFVFSHIVGSHLSSCIDRAIHKLDRLLREF